MPWAKIARVLELSRAPASVAVALACAAGMTVGPCREIPQARVFVFGIGFAFVLVAAVVVLTALLAIAEHAADDATHRARREIRIPTAIAAYRTAPATRSSSSSIARHPRAPRPRPPAPRLPEEPT